MQNMGKFFQTFPHMHCTLGWMWALIFNYFAYFSIEWQVGQEEFEYTCVELLQDWVWDYYIYEKENETGEFWIIGGWILLKR